MNNCACNCSCPDKVHEETGEIDGIQKIQYELFQTYIWCCAANDLGRECTGLFTIGNFPLSLLTCKLDLAAEVSCTAHLGITSLLNYLFV